MTEDKGYNGWKNYETWSVALIVDNDEGTYNDRREIVRRAVSGYVSDHGESPRNAVADALKDWIEDFQPHSDELQGIPFAYLWDQLLSAALSEVDWYELAENWMEDEAEDPTE